MSLPMTESAPASAPDSAPDANPGPLSDPLFDHARFEHAFGAALAGHDHAWHADARVNRALIIHRNTSHKAAQDALAANYPVIVQLVGSEAFSACAAAFVEHHPASEPRLCVYGAGFSAFLGSYAAFAELGWLAEVARLEWAVVEALFAADADSFDGQRLDLERPLALCAASRSLRLAMPAASIWLAHQPGGDTDALETLAWTAEVALVTRPAGTVIVTIIDAIAADFLDDCNAGAPLGEAAASAADKGADLAAMFAALIGAGVFSSADLGE